MNTTALRFGIDLGSTTAKVVGLDGSGVVRFSAYRRHHTDTLGTLLALLEQARAAVGDGPASLLVTGSAGLGLSERAELPFIQEVIASAEVVRQRFPQARTLLDIGGEDAKLIFFDGDGPPEICMNGACAGGTGAFIDQMATLLGVPIGALSRLAAEATQIYPIASRCGVFAKTDVQNLLSRDARPEDVAASIFHAVVLQTLATLARGRTLEPPLLFAGGPLTFLPALKQAFVQALELPPGGWLEVDQAELISALGAALKERGRSAAEPLPAWIERLQSRPPESGHAGRLPQLFGSENSRRSWAAEQSRWRVAHTDLRALAGEPCFLGIDSGSTTTKLALVDSAGRLAYSYYANNQGNAVGATRAGLERLREALAGLPQPPRLVRSAVTGYGEDLVRAAFGCDDGLVETVAHFRAAQAFDPDVSFVLDIGGQDMKALFIRDGHIQRVEINEACSSGCGTFVESFAQSLGRPVADFADGACRASAPCDLGTRCTVFMNSRVKQALREGAAVDDIAAGLAYAVIRNALHKVLKLTDTAVLGEHIVVQGGAFRNPAMQRALELVLGRPVACPDKAELMGALGAALAARDAFLRLGPGRGVGIGLAGLAAASDYRKQAIRCRGCENRCAVTKLAFASGRQFFTGNRCERTYSNRGREVARGTVLHTRKRALLFDRPLAPAEPARLTIGVPRALNQYENFPFWATLFVGCGLAVRLSAPSSPRLAERGASTVMSENVCFPAKLLHGHIFDLIEAKVDRIFLPMVFYEACEFGNSINCFNCPIVAGYADVVQAAIDPAGRYHIPLDKPAVTFREPGLLRRVCRDYLVGLGTDPAQFDQAFKRALAAQAGYKAEVRALGAAMVKEARPAGRPVVVLAGHPYHVDPLINHNIPEALADMGVDVLTEDAVPIAPRQALGDLNVLSQWEYLNRIFHAARWAAQQPGIEMAQLNSFGCGPDAFAIDEVRRLLAEHGKNHTVIRVDEIDSLGSSRLRLRSMLEAGGTVAGAAHPRRTTRLYSAADREKVILAPVFSRFCTPPLVRPLLEQGLPIEVLPAPDQETIQIGLKYTNNEICYPGILVIGDIIKALQSGRYDPARTVAGSWETGGQCRASNISCLLKQALVAAGYDNVPVVTLSTRLKPYNAQPGFQLNMPRYLYQALLAMTYTDGLSALYHASAPREREPGAAWRLAEGHLAAFAAGQPALNPRAVLQALRQAVADFSALPLDDRPRPRVALIGEVYVKYNPFINHNLAAWLMAQGLEVQLPPLLAFFMGSFEGQKAAVMNRIRRADVLSTLSAAAHRPVQAFVDRAETVLRTFRHYLSHNSISHVAQTAHEVVELTHQYGEGWLLSGEVGEYARAGVRHLVCLQPFGCIANHVVAKGVARRLKARFPGLNLLFLDLDAGLSEVNYFNRLHFFVEQALADAPATAGPA